MTLTRMARAQLIVLTAGFLALSLGVGLAEISPVLEYEPSPYDATPLVWVLLTLAIALGALYTVLGARYRSFGRSAFLYAGIALVLVARLTANFVGWLRGYYFVGRTDNLTHWGFALGIEETGYTDPNNIYPLMHILLAQGSLLTGLSVKAMMVLLPAVLGLLVTASIYLILRRLFEDERVVALGTLSASLLLFGGAGPEMSSSGLSLILIPLFLYLYLRSRTSLRYAIPLILLLVAYPFIHPLTSLLLIAFLALGEMVAWRVRGSHPRMAPVLLLFLAFFSWFSATVAFGHSVRSAVSLLSGEFQASHLAVYQAQAAQAALPLADFARVLAISYADWAIFLLVGLLAIVLLRPRPLFSVRASVIPLIIPFNVLLIASLYVVNLGFDPIRFVAFLMVGAVVYAGFVFTRLMRGGQARRLRGAAVTVVAVLIVTAGVISVYKSYPSSLVLRPGTHVTQSEVLGYFWFFEKREPATLTYELLSGAGRFAYIFPESLGGGQGLAMVSRPTPDHFGYTVGEAPGSALAPGYLIVTAMDVATYTRVWASAERFTAEDLARLAEDPGVHRVYASGQLAIYHTP